MKDNEFVFLSPMERLFKDSRFLVTRTTWNKLISGNVNLAGDAVEFEFAGTAYVVLPAKSIDLRKDKSLTEIKITPWK